MPAPFENFYGNPEIAAALQEMIRGGRTPQTMLFSGPEGIGKATLARRFGAELARRRAEIERDDLSLEPNLAVIVAWGKEEAQRPCQRLSTGRFRHAQG